MPDIHWDPDWRDRESEPGNWGCLVALLALALFLIFWNP